MLVAIVSEKEREGKMREIYGFGENRGAFTLTGKPLRLMVVFASLLIFACSKPLDPSLRMGAGEQGSTCSVTNSSSCHLPIKILSQSPSSIQVLRGNRVHLSVMVQGFQLSFQWYKNSQLLPNEKGSALEISAAEDLDAGAYQLQVSDGYGVQLWSNEMTIEIAEVTQNFKPIITSGPMDLTVNENQTATFTVEMTANPAPSYQWYFEGMPLQGKTTNSLTIQNVTVSDSGEYHVVLENALGKTTSRFATLRVQACDPKGKKIMDFASVLANSVLAGWPITHLTDGNLASAYSSQKT
ncbi:MAG: immunoglobulin domain-containing protein, partial [Bdellovibrionales bacterium]|nr:immunoglobulin domain-containing protein [Bdellovibrionales bacterium]